MGSLIIFESSIQVMLVLLLLPLSDINGFIISQNTVPFICFLSVHVFRILGQNPPRQNPPPDKTPLPKPPGDKTPLDKTPPDKTPRTKPPRTKPPPDKAPLDKTPPDKQILIVY